MTRTRRWLRHPAATVQRPLVCPTGWPRHATEALALQVAALAIIRASSSLRPYQCNQCNGGWHLTDADTPR